MSLKEEHLNQELKIPFKFIKFIIVDWWDSWHRYAEEEQELPENILELINLAENQLNIKFNISQGYWET